MDILTTIYNAILVQPVYNLFIAAYSTVGQNQAGVTLILFGLVSGILFLPVIVSGYFDQARTKALQDQIQTIKEKVNDSEERQNQILKLLSKKQITFQSESIFLFGQAVLLGLLYPVLIHHFTQLDTSLLYPFTPVPDSFSPQFGVLDLGRSDATLSLVPAVLLFFELRQSYKEQDFLTGFVDKWYPIILPLFVYFLIFWLPSGLALVLSATLVVSLYLRQLFILFGRLRRR